MLGRLAQGMRCFSATSSRLGIDFCSLKRTNASAPPHLRTSAPPHLRTSAPPHLRTSAPPPLRPSAPPPHRPSAPPHLRAPTPPHLRTSAPPHLRTSAPPHLRTSAPPRLRASAQQLSCRMGAGPLWPQSGVLNHVSGPNGPALLMTSAHLPIAIVG